MSNASISTKSGRPREFDRELVLDAAMLQFWQYGYEATSIANLRKAMGGISVASLYSAFGGKEELFQLCVERYRKLPGHVSQVLNDETLAPLEAITESLRSAVFMQSDPEHAFGCLVLLGATNHSEPNTHIYDYLRHFREEVTQRVLELLHRARQDGDLNSAYSDKVLAELFRVVLNGIALHARDGASPEQLLQVVRVIEDLLN